VRAVLEADGIVERIGADHIHTRLRGAVESASPGTPPGASQGTTRSPRAEPPRTSP
jgi:hypothetical protein